MIRSSYSLESPLDSTATYPKTETLSRANLTLRIPLELDDDDLGRNKMERLYWLCLLDEVLRIAPPYSTIGELLLWRIFTYPLSPYGWQASSIWSLRDGLSWTCTSFLHSSSCWCLEGTHEIPLHLILQDTLAIGSTLSWPTFGLHLEHIGRHLIFFKYILDANKWLKNGLWTNPTNIAQCKH